MCVSAEQMLNVPSVTMNGGRLRLTTSPPLTTPTSMQVRTPSRIAISGGTPESTASLVITIEPSAIAVPQDRSMPAVRMISVWPIASVPITITCWMIREKFVGSRNWSDCVVKKMHARISAISGPSCATRSPETFGIVRPPPLPPPAGGAAGLGVRARGLCLWLSHMWSPLCRDVRRRPARGAGRPSVALAPAVLLAVGGVLGLDAVDRVGGDELDARVDVARGLLAAACCRRALLHAQRRHLQRVLLRGGVDHAGLDAALDRVTATVDGHEDEVLRVLAGRLERGRAAEARWLVDRVDDVDVRVLL